MIMNRRNTGNLICRLLNTNQISACFGAGLGYGMIFFQFPFFYLKIKISLIKHFNIDSLESGT